MDPSGRSDDARGDPLDRTLAVSLAILLLTLAAASLPGVEVRLVAPGLDLLVDTATTLVTLAVAVLAWMRFRNRGERAALFQASAFVILAVARAISAALALRTLDAATGPSPSPLSEDALWLSTIARVTAAGLLVAGGALSAPGGGIGRPVLVVVGPSAVLLALAALAPLWVAILPTLVGSIPPQVGPTGGSATIAGSTNPVLPAATLVNIPIQGVGSALFAWAALLSRRRLRGDGSIADRYLAVGLLVAAFAQAHLALFPSAYAGVLTSGDLLYLAFDVILLLGVEAEMRAYLVRLRQANLRLASLRDAEVDRAALDERARLSRELHDGLAQHLWLAKLKVGRLTALPELAGEARILCGELDVAIDAGLAEARQAVMALRVGGEPEASFCELMGRYADDFGDRFGIRVEFDADDSVPRLSTRAEAELLRIAQEALSNVRRHADATVVWVHVGVDAGRLTLTIRDNGRGFDPGATGHDGFGLTSMRERAGLIGGRFAVTSKAHDGTRVTVDLAVPEGRQARMIVP